MVDAIVRPASWRDLQQVLDLYRHLHPQEPPLEKAAAKQVWTTLLASSSMNVIVAQTTTDLLVSSCTLAIVPNLSRGGRPYGVIENVVTHTDYRRLGLAQRVLAHALELAWRADCYKVHLATGSRREETLRLYERAGFSLGGKTYFEVRRP